LPLLTVIAVAGCASAGGGSSGDSSAGGDQTRSAAHQAAVTGAAAAATGSAQPPAGAGPGPARVNWATVGAGWSLAEYSGSSSGDATPRHQGATLLYLVGPNGSRYTLYQWPAGQTDWSLLDWSGDKTRALFGGPDGAVGQLVLATGTFTRFTLPAGTQAIGYSRPGGAAILATQQVMSTDQVLRYSLTGRQEQVLASGPSDADNTAVYAPDGTTLAVNGAKALELVTNEGKVVRSLPVPGHPTCQPVRWWNARTILASCVAPGTTAPRLWLVPSSGATPTALTAQRGSTGPDLGDINAWPLPSGTYLQALGACGVIFIAQQTPTGGAATVAVPGTTGNDNQIVTASGPRLLVRAQTSCEPSTSLLWFTPTTHAVQFLIRTPATTAGVTAAVPYAGN
jgi:TolB protein